jgi:hypothetical protein
MIDKKSNTQWTKASISYLNYQEYIKKKGEDKFALTLIDLFYISNFKGGNATINENENMVLQKLKSYSSILSEIEKKFKNKKLSDLDIVELNQLIDLVNSICELTNKKTSTKIDGFSDSYLSALLSAYFPKLIPILDRRILINLNIVKNKDVNKQGQVKNIRSFYPELLLKIKELSILKNMEIREIDRELFIKKLNVL